MFQNTEGILGSLFLVKIIIEWYEGKMHFYQHLIILITYMNLFYIISFIFIFMGSLISESDTFGNCSRPDYLSYSWHSSICNLASIPTRT